MAKQRYRLTTILSAVVLGGTVGLALAGPLHDAARSGDSARLQALLDAGEDFQAIDARGDTPLIAAAYNGQRPAVVELLDHGAAIDGRSDRGMTALHAASYRGHAEIVSLLLDRGADVNDQANKFRITPLHAAAEEGHLDVVNLLISAGADLDIGEANAVTAISRAGWKENWLVFETLRKAGARCQPESVVGEALYTRCVAIEP